MVEPGLNRAEAAIIAASLAHSKQEDAAKAAGVSLRTFQRTIAREHVRAALAREATRRLRGVVVGLARHAEVAADALGKMAAGEIQPNGARVRACIGVLEYAVRAIEVEDFEARLRELELSQAFDQGRGGAN